MNLKIISAGAGSGKTYRLTSEMVEMLTKPGANGRPQVKASDIIATTFTNKAAAELQERVRVRLLQEGYRREANDLTNALIGTVHSLGVSLLKRFAYEAGVSPQVDIMVEEDQQVMFNQSLAMVLAIEKVEAMENLVNRLGLNKNRDYDWRRDVKQITEVARTNNFSKEVLKKSSAASFESFLQFLPEGAGLSKTELFSQLKIELEAAIERLESSTDETKITQSAIEDLRALLNELNTRGELFWFNFAKISKIKTGVKSRDLLDPLLDFVAQHEACPAFRQDIKDFIDHIFDFAIAAIEEYDRYKKQRGLIDFTDMEVLVNRLLDQPQVAAALREELDLLMVDEFQDTSPIQLEIFLKLSRLAKFSVWVGDPKQSIYGFRGADPALMEAIIGFAGGIQKENILEHSWRSREDLVYAANAVFTKAFQNMPPDQVQLFPKREKAKDAAEMTEALVHWHFEPDPEAKKSTNIAWFENSVAEMLRLELERGIYILPKGEKNHRCAKPGDVAILCRSNDRCKSLAEALNRAGLNAAISRAGLLKTAEARLILACLKFLLHKHDSLSIAEILKLGAGWSTEQIIDHRLDFLDEEAAQQNHRVWATDAPIIAQLDELRAEILELSSAELLTLLLDDLDLRRKIVRWGRVEHRLANGDVLCALSLDYEEACNRLHAAASLGGFLLWLNDLEEQGKDLQGSGENAGAVNVLTYHKSKGLEYPVTICFDLENDLRSDVWGISLVQEKSVIELDNLLGNRWLRFWINPYGDQIKGTPLYERITESVAHSEANLQARNEEKRLLYVGMTRARDYLVFPSRLGKATKWLNRVWNGEDEHTALDPYISASPWEWGGREVPVSIKIQIFAADFQLTPRQEAPVKFIEPYSGKQAYPPLKINADKEIPEKMPPPKIGQLARYGAWQTFGEATDLYATGKSIKAFLIADAPADSEEDRIKMAEGLLKRYGVSEFLEAEKLVRFGAAFFENLKKELDLPDFSGPQFFRKYPLKNNYEGRIFETVLDFLALRGDEIFIIQNSGHAGRDEKSILKKAADLAVWAYFARGSIQALFPGKKVRCFINFVLSGAMVEVENI